MTDQGVGYPGDHPVQSACDESDPFKAVESKLDLQGRKLHCRYWRPASKPRALMMIIHGYSEHLYWYDDIGRRFAEEGVLAFGHDHVGHGLSDGDRAHVDDFEDYVSDVFAHVEQMKSVYPDLPRFALGHSMGGLVLLTAALKKPEEFSGVTLMAPLLYIEKLYTNPLLVYGIRCIGNLAPQIKVWSSRVDVTRVTRDVEMGKKIEADSLRYFGGLKARWTDSIGKAMVFANGNFSKMSVPFLVIHSSQDKICNVEGAKQLYEASPCRDKELKIIEDAAHSLHIETVDVRTELAKDLVSWVLNRIRS